MKQRITITINKKIWKILCQLKLDNDIKTFDEVIIKLLKEVNENETMDKETA